MKKTASVVLLTLVIIYCFTINNVCYISSIKPFIYSQNDLQQNNENLLIRLETSKLTKKSSDLTKTCWKNTFALNKKNVTVSSPQNVLCLFKPLKMETKKEFRKPIVVLGVGVHLGPAADNKEVLPKAGFKYISWEFRDKQYNRLQNNLIHGYSKEHLKLTQELFWNAYKNDSELNEADIIVCGFDVWHCLIFAPFNKKIVINSNYRFDGHLGTSYEDMIELQKELYNAVRYNPDVIMAGGILYDVMYQQHYLGSHKIIPLPASCEYVQSRIKKDLQEKKNCINECKKAVNKTLVVIFPKRLSKGGEKIANEIIQEARKKERSFEIKHFEECFSKGYNYCQLDQFDVAIMLGYSVMSYFSCEVANIGIPLFVPTPELYANYEKLYHLVEERKQRLGHTSYDAMKQSSRSLNFGYNPNDDFDEKALQRWLSYSDYYYYGGVELFNNYENLFNKISTTNLINLKQNAYKHRIENAKIGVEHWQAIGMYFFGETDFPHEETIIPNTLKEGLEMWQNAVSRPNFTSTGGKYYDGIPVVAVLLEDLNGIIPECSKFKYVKIVLLTNRTEIVNECHLLNYETLLKNFELNLFFSRSFTKLKKWHEIAMVMYAISQRASKITIFSKLGKFSRDCYISNEFEFLGDEKLWTLSFYDSSQYWYIFAPEDNQVFKYWIKTVSSFTSELDTILLMKCRTFFQNSEKKFSEEEIDYLSSYLQYWQSDETESFFHIVDQLNFELAVRGYLSKLHAKLHRWLLYNLVQLGYYQLPLINKLIET
ncbi:uncharacterized protein LOC100203540 [Hydra vulgaris]|uniref:uncharacterized protein LOC100203540 n=1 Tax=Hydra vulgaris TaxID=6087 RepID=UPI001F5E7BEF|nr:uncharacterized protein LOC100203540 [Hydra vulgaris]